MSNYIADPKYNGTIHRAFALIIDRALQTDGVDNTVNSLIHAMKDENLVPTPISRVRVGDVLSNHGKPFTVKNIEFEPKKNGGGVYLFRSEENPDDPWHVQDYSIVYQMNPASCDLNPDSGITQHEAEALLHAVREMSGNETVTHPDGRAYRLDDIGKPRRAVADVQIIIYSDEDVDIIDSTGKLATIYQSDDTGKWIAEIYDGTPLADPDVSHYDALIESLEGYKLRQAEEEFDTMFAAVDYILHYVYQNKVTWEIIHADCPTKILELSRSLYGIKRLRLSEEYVAVIEGDVVNIEASPDASHTGCVFHADKIAELAKLQQKN